jgi:hypothetical protein
MFTHLYYDRTPVQDAKSLLTKFVGKALRSPMRSTVPLLDMALNARQELMAILAACGAEPESDLRFEYEVRSTSHSANASQTDLMVLGKSNAVAVEAKWTEPVYECVSKRLLRRTILRKGDNSFESVSADRRHQEAQVRAWLDKLQPLSRQTLTMIDMADVVYQVMHRAASAVATGLSPSVVYLHFEDAEIHGGANADDYKRHLDHLYVKLGRPSTLALYVVTQPIVRTQIFRSIEMLNKREPATSTAVCNALSEGPLFTYGEAVTKQVI